MRYVMKWGARAHFLLLAVRRCFRATRYEGRGACCQQMLFLQPICCRCCYVCNAVWNVVAIEQHNLISHRNWVMQYDKMVCLYTISRYSLSLLCVTDMKRKEGGCWQHMLLLHPRCCWHMLLSQHNIWNTHAHAHEWLAVDICCCLSIIVVIVFERHSMPQQLCTSCNCRNKWIAFTSPSILHAVVLTSSKK